MTTAENTTIGYLTNASSLDTTGLVVNEADLQAITSVDVPGWREAVLQIPDYYTTFGTTHLASFNLGLMLWKVRSDRLRDCNIKSVFSELE